MNRQRAKKKQVARWRGLARQASEQRTTERRRDERRTTGRLRLESALVAGRLINQSSDGFAIETERGLRVGEYYALQARNVPEDTPGHAGCLAPRFEGRVRWCILRFTIRRSDGEVAPVFRAGFERATESQGSSKDTGFIDFSPPST